MKIQTKLTILILLFVATTGFSQSLKQVKLNLSAVQKQSTEVLNALNYFAKKTDRSQRKLIANRIVREATTLSTKAYTAYKSVISYKNSNNSKGVSSSRIEAMSSNAYFIYVKAKNIARDAKKAKKSPSKQLYQSMKKAYLKIADNYDVAKNAYNNIVKRRR